MGGDPGGVGNVARLMTMVPSMPQFHITKSNLSRAQLLAGWRHSFLSWTLGYPKGVRLSSCRVKSVGDISGVDELSSVV
jgi:hypothetical protein